MRSVNLNKPILALLCAVFLCSFLATPARAVGIIDALKDKIKSAGEQIQKLNTEINQYQKELDTTNVKAKSLTQDINVLTTTKKKLDGEILSTEKNIALTSSTISEITADINAKEQKITENRQVIQRMLQNLQQETNNSLVEAFLQDRSLSSIGEYLDHTEKFEEKIQGQIEDLFALKEQLAGRKVSAETKKKDLAQFKTELGGKKQAIVQTQKEKDKVLAATKNVQANYQKILAEKIRLKVQFEREMFAYESEIKLSVDTNKLPTIGASTLQWPLDSVRITQYFGATVDAKRLYVSGSHNGIDLGATDGTKVKAALSATVAATGNTDLKVGCSSYGKWVLLKHTNGLSTLYAHLSVISVNAGDPVSTGDIIGFSGRTGYSTGPHLHFSVYASDAVVVQPFANGIGCKNVTIPVAAPSAYLDPILYLPKPLL